VLLSEIDAFRANFLEYINSLAQKDIDNVASQLIANQSITAISDEQILQKYHYSFSVGALDRYDERAQERTTALKNVSPVSLKKTFRLLENSGENGQKVIIKSIGSVNLN